MNTSEAPKPGASGRFPTYRNLRYVSKYLLALILSFVALPGLLSAQTLLHRYSFATDASDSVGGPTWNGTAVAPNGGSPVVFANGATLAGGGGPGFSGYVSFPAGILTNTTNITIECWATETTANNWAELWNFNNSQSQYFGFIPQPANNGNNMSMAIRNGAESDAFSADHFPTGTQQYIAGTFNASTLVGNLYTNGILIASVTVPNATYTPGTYGGAAGTVNNWLGQDPFPDPQFQGTIFEFRIWNGVVSQRYLAASAIEGPSVVVNNTTPTSVTVSAGNNVIITGTLQASVTVQLAATGSANLPATGDATNWVSSNPNVLAVNQNGVITGVGTGSATVSATVGGIVGTTGTITVTGAQTLQHRYSFATDASDSIGGPTWNGTLVPPTGAGTAASINNGLLLPGGGGPGFSGYLSLPAGILTNTTSVTVECWVNQAAVNTWAEIWDFANAPSGSQTFGLIAFPNNNGHHTEVSFTPNGNERDLQSSSYTFPTNSEQYIAVTYNNFSLAGNLYTNGAIVASTTFPSTAYAPGSYGGATGTLSNMLGQDIFPDPQFQGTIYEFRIWNGSLSPVYVAVANAAGPSVVVNNLTPLALNISVTNTSMLGAQVQPATATGNFADAANVIVTDGATNWVSSNPSILTVNSSGLITAVSGGTATVSATVNGVTATSPTITVASTAPTAQGPTNAVAVAGDTVTFAVTALGGNLTFQWSHGVTQIPGATNATLVLTNVNAASAGTYSVSITNNLGSINPSATLTIVPQILKHRYSFQTNAVDSVGGANGTLVGPNGGTAATINNGLILPGGGGPGFSGYVSLPSGMLTNINSISVEVWVTQSAPQTWAEIWDFANNGSQNFGLIPDPQNNNNNMEVAFTPNGGEVDLQSAVSFPSGSEQYVSLTYDSGSLVANLYTNGTVVATHTYPNSTYTPANIGGAGGTTVNVLGQDIFPDPQFQGTIFEFRIWDGVVSPLYLAISAAAGPSVVVTNLTPTLVSVTVTNATMTPGTSQPAVVSGNFHDASGIIVTAGATNWVSSNPSVLTVDQSGNITAVTTGSATISATVNGVTGTSASISVPTSPPIITVEPNAADTLIVGATLHTTLANIGTPPFTYFWFTNSNPTPISISSSPALTVANVQTGNAATYFCLVSNQFGTTLSSNLDLAVITPSAYEQVLLQLNPIALWPLNEASGTTAFDVIGGNNGTYNGGVGLGQPGPTNAFFAGATGTQFDGSDSFVDIAGAPFNITGAVTVMTWAQDLAQNGFDGVIGHGDPSWRIAVTGTGNPAGNDSTVSGDAGTSISILDNNWHLLAYTYSGNPSQPNNGLLYIDGVLVGSNSVTATPPGDNLDVWIGGSPDYGIGATKRLFAGNIADSAVFARALTAAQIQGVFNGTFVVGQLPAPTITHALLSGANIVIRGTNNAGAGGTYHLLSSTNLTVPLSNWSTVTSGSFDANGNVNSTNPVNPTTPRNFYILQVP